MYRTSAGGGQAADGRHVLRDPAMNRRRWGALASRGRPATRPVRPPELKQLEGPMSNVQGSRFPSRRTRLQRSLTLDSDLLVEPEELPYADPNAGIFGSLTPAFAEPSESAARSAGGIKADLKRPVKNMSRVRIRNLSAVDYAGLMLSILAIWGQRWGAPKAWEPWVSVRTRRGHGGYKLAASRSQRSQTGRRANGRNSWSAARSARYDESVRGPGNVGSLGAL